MYLAIFLIASGRSLFKNHFQIFYENLIFFRLTVTSTESNSKSSKTIYIEKLLNYKNAMLELYRFKETDLLCKVV